MSLKKQVIASLFAFFIGLTLTACGGGGSDTSTNIPTNIPTNTNTGGQYDLSKYLFHTNVLSNNGEVSFTEKLFEKDTGEQAFLNLNRKFTSADGVFIEEFSDSSLFKTYKINANNIEENIISADAIRLTNRFTNVGGIFQDANNTSTLGSNTITQNSSCTLLEHFDSFNLTSVTGNFNLTSGIYSDVLKVECITSFVTGGQTQPHTTLRSYFAKDVGVIFSEGVMILGGNVYITEEY